MRVLCTPDFKKEYNRLIRKNKYKDLRALLVAMFKDAEPGDVESGSRIFAIPNRPYIKKRLGGSGKFRLDYIFLSDKNEVCLLFVYSKKDLEDLDIEKRKSLLKDFVQRYKDNDLSEIHFDGNGIKMKGLAKSKVVGSIPTSTSIITVILKPKLTRPPIAIWFIELKICACT